MTSHCRWLIPMLAAWIGLSGGCGRDQTATPTGPATGAKPNILFVVWDTVRADHLSLYGYERRTTPFVDEWARQARVFENCISAASTTVPSHASMFTGLLPTEHGASNQMPVLIDEFETLAELLKATGYGTYAFCANPYITNGENRKSLTQGFDLVEHPWSPRFRAKATEIIRRKASPQDRSHHFCEKLAKNKPIQPAGIKACGELAQVGVESWLASEQRGRPFFIFLNYMEAHGVLIPEREFRRQMMTPEQICASYRVDRSWATLWAYVFGLHDYTSEEIELTVATYDAALLELDGLFRDLIESLRDQGDLDNTIVVLVGDHGEHLGEHHLFEHQFSVYEPLMRVPLVIHYPPSVAAAREQRAVTNLDIFPTLLELLGIRPPVVSTGVSLLRPAESRPRLGEYLTPTDAPAAKVRQQHPHFDPQPWMRTLRAYYQGPYKYIQASDGRHELYNLDDDPGELHNLIRERPEVAHRLARDLKTHLESLKVFHNRTPIKPYQPTPEMRSRLEALGYLSDADRNSDDEPGSDEATNEAASQPAPKPPVSQPKTP